MKTKLRILSILMALVMCLSLFAGCASKDDDDDDDRGSGKKDKETVTETVGEGKEDAPSKSAVKDDPMGAIANALADEFAAYGESLAAPFSVLEKAAAQTATYGVNVNVEGVEVDLSVVADPEAVKAFAEANVSAYGVELDADLWLGEDIVVKVPKLLGDSAYGVNIGSAIDDLKTSYLLDMMGVTYDELMESLEDEMGMSIDELMELMEMTTGAMDMTDEAEALVEDVMDIIGGLDTKVKDDEYDGEDAYKITITLKIEDYEKLFEAVIDFYKDAFTEILEKTGQDYVLDEMDDAIEDFKDSMADAEVKSVDFEIYLDKKDESFIAAAFENDDLAIAFEIESDEDEPLNKKFVIAGTEKYDDYEETSEIVFEISVIDEKGKSGFEISAGMGYDDDGEYVFEEAMNISFERDTKSGEFRFAADVDYETVAIEGTLVYTDSKLAFGLGTIDVGGDVVEIDFELSVELGGKLESAPKYKNVLKMTEDDWMDLAEVVQNSEFFG